MRLIDRAEPWIGVDVDELVRLCAMNLYLRTASAAATAPVVQGHALAGYDGRRCDVVLTNPPFGKKSSCKVVGEDGSVTSERERCHMHKTPKTRRLRRISTSSSAAITRGRRPSAFSGLLTKNSSSAAS